MRNFFLSLILLLPSLVLANTTTFNNVTNFGLGGGSVYSVDCTKKPSVTNPRITFFANYATNTISFEYNETFYIIEKASLSVDQNRLFLDLQTKNLHTLHVQVIRTDNAVDGFKFEDSTDSMQITEQVGLIFQPCVNLTDPQ